MVSGNSERSPDSIKQSTHSASEERGNHFIGRVILMQVARPISLSTVGSNGFLINSG